MRISSTYVMAAIITAMFAAQFTFAATSSTASTTPNPPSFNITSTALALCRGEVNEVPVTVTNLGYSPALAYGQGAPNVQGPQMQQVDLNINGKGLYSEPNSNDNNVNPDNSIVINVPVFVDANVSSLEFAQVDITYNYLYLYTDSETRNLTFATEDCNSPLLVSVSPELLVSGTIQNITVNLTNTGATTLNSLSLHFTIPGQDGAWLSPQPLQIQSIAPGAAMSFNRNVYIAGNESDQSVPLNVSVIFYNGSQLNQIYQNLEILSSGLILLTPSSFTVSPTIPSPSSIFSVSFIVTDTGTAGASALTATALPPHGFTPFGSNSVFVGSITADSQTPVTISITASNSVKPGTYNIPIRLNYLNNLRENLTTWANTTVTIGQPIALNSTTATRFRSNSNSSGGLLTLILAIAVIALGYLYYKELRRSGRTITIGKIVIMHGKKKEGA